MEVRYSLLYYVLLLEGISVKCHIGTPLPMLCVIQCGVHEITLILTLRNVSLYGVLLLENESHQTALAMVEEEDQFADCLELVSVLHHLMLLCS